MLVGLVLAVFFYSGDREYEDPLHYRADEHAEEVSMNAECWKALAGAVTAFLAQLYLESRPLALCVACW